MSWLRAVPRRAWWRAVFLVATTPALLGVPAGTPQPDRAAGLPGQEQDTPDAAVWVSPDSPRAQRDRLLARLGVDRWHRAGLLGQGVKVAVLDAGFRDYRSFLGKALPATVTVRSFRRDGDLE